ncbi:hypothetical protein [Allorhizobium ampelinum]|uniref:hypothetical protein n=1 Tax=Allorhizobium ampelinum TaxID=3025782 RepID=UPI000B3F7FC2|nr:hypothetical protein [Allorhizobium ampelinum]NTA27446.1 hypothetical protein [Allorhizobium ampelinum]OVE94503.1 hypothetical protein B7W85_13200 [Allorhizobium ampelinum]
MSDLPRDLHQAQSFVDRAAAINAKADHERMSIMRAINKAIVVVLFLGFAGTFIVAAEEHQKKMDLINQEQVAYK